MKRFIRWLAKVFNADITKTEIVEKEVTYYLPQNGTIEGDITIKGNLLVTGSLKVTGSLTCKSFDK